MSENRKTISQLKDAKRIVVGYATTAVNDLDYKAKIRWDLRRAYIDEKIAELSGFGKFPQRVFISYSQQTGVYQYNFIKQLLMEKKFDIVDGFMRHEGDDGYVLKRVTLQLSSCSIYVCILTCEEEVETKAGKKFIPSVWTIEEKGMALGLQKPFVLLADERIDKKYWIKTTPDKLHFIFNSDNFHEKAKQAVAQIIDRWNELSIRAQNFI